MQLTSDTLGTYQKSFDLTQRSYDVGVASALDLRQAQTAVKAPARPWRSTPAW